MRQVASVIKDGKVVYFIADAEEGELAEFATVAVSESFDAVAAVKLGFNLIAAVGLNGHKAPEPVQRRAVFQLPPEPLPGIQLAPTGKRPERWTGTETVVAFVAWQPGCRVADIHQTYGVSPEAASSAVTRAVAAGRIVRRAGQLYPPSGILATPRPAPEPRRVPSKAWRGKDRKKWDLTQAQVIDFIQANPGCRVADLVAAFFDGEDTKPTRQTVQNRIAAINDRGARGAGPVIAKTYERVPGTDSEIVRYRIEGDDASVGDGEPGLG